MGKSVRLLLLAAISGSCGTGSGSQNANLPVQVDVGVESPAYVDAIAAGRTFLDSLTTAFNVPGLSMAVGLGRELIWSEARGYADVATRRPMSTTTPLRIYSVSKPVTAFVLAKLVESGELDLDAPIQEYVPSFPAKDKDISLRQLGGHLAGIRHYQGDDEVHNRRRYRTVLESVDQFANDPLLHAPGLRHSYSSYGFNLIGAAIEHVCGAAFAQCLDRYVLTPVGIPDTYLDGLGSSPSTEPTYYELTADGLTVAPDMDLSNRWPGGGMVSTATDLVAFGLAMFSDDYLSKPIRELLLTPQITTSGDSVPYGIGWSLTTGPGGTPVAFHRGGSTGGMSFLAMLPEYGFVFAILLNVNGELGDARPPQQEAMSALMLFLRDSVN